MRPCKNLIIWHWWKYFWKSYLTLEHLKVIWQLYKTEWERNINDARYTVWKLVWRGGCRMGFCQEIKCFWRKLFCLNIIVTRWNLGTRNEILSFVFLFFLWDNASQKLRIPSHFAKCEPLIRILKSPIRFTKLTNTSAYPKPLEIESVNECFRNLMIKQSQHSSVKGAIDYSEGIVIFIELISNWFKMTNVKDKYSSINC